MSTLSTDPKDPTALTNSQYQRPLDKLVRFPINTDAAEAAILHVNRADSSGQAALRVSQHDPRLNKVDASWQAVPMDSRHQTIQRLFKFIISVFF